MELSADHYRFGETPALSSSSHFRMPSQPFLQWCGRVVVVWLRAGYLRSSTISPLFALVAVNLVPHSVPQPV